MESYDDHPDEPIAPWTRAIWLGHPPRSQRATPFLCSDLCSNRWTIGLVDGRRVRTLADIACYDS